MRLLARTPIDSLSTHQLAAELDLTQPALFRHFPSRDALLLAVIDHARRGLEQVAAEVVGAAKGPVDQLQSLGRALLAFAEREPALPRLLFATATPSAGKVREALQHIVAMQVSLVAELVRQGQRVGEFDPALDPAAAATLYVGMLQGLILRWELSARRESLPGGFTSVFGLWLRGVEAGRKGSRAPARPPSAEVASGAATKRSRALALLDVRPIITGGQDPLRAILSAVEALPPSGMLVLDAPFRPAPLLALLSRRGHGVAATEVEAGHWIVEVVVGGAPPVEDLRDLEPPEPMERVLAASEALRPGGIYLARLPRIPRLLLPHLRERELRFEVLERADGAAVLRVEKAP